MYAHEIAAYTRRILDDPNLVFLPDAVLATYLQRAEAEYRNYAPEEVFALSATPVVLANSATLNLDGTLFGATATQPRCQRILRVIMVTATGQLMTVFEPASSFESLAPSSSNAITALTGFSARWWLDGRLLRFSLPINGRVQVVYLPDSQVNWATAIAPPVPPALGVYVDDLGQWHDIIGLLAAQQYAMPNAAANPKIDERLMLRRREMDAFYAQTRSGQGSRYVRDDGW